MPDVAVDSAGVPDTIQVINNVPYCWLLSQVSLVVHHFGFGTTAEVLKAGLPAIPVPYIFDQKIRANQIHKLGYAYKPLDKNKLTKEKLADAITRVKSDTEMIAGCRRVGEEISGENGIEKAIRLIGRTFGG